VEYPGPAPPPPQAPVQLRALPVPLLLSDLSIALWARRRLSWGTSVTERGSSQKACRGP